MYLNVAKRFGAAPFASSNNPRDPSHTASVLIVVATSTRNAAAKVEGSLQAAGICPSFYLTAWLGWFATA